MYKKYYKLSLTSCVSRYAVKPLSPTCVLKESYTTHTAEAKYTISAALVHASRLHACSFQSIDGITVDR